MMKLKEYGYDYVSSPFRFFDGCLITNKKKVLVKYLYNADSLKKNIADAMKKFSKTFNKEIYIVAEKTKRKKIGNEIHIRYDIPVVSYDSFLDIIENKRKIDRIYKRGKIIVKIDGKKLEKIRKEKGIKRSKLAKILGTSYESIYMYEKGYINVDYDKYLKLKKLLEIEIESFEIFNFEINEDPLEDEIDIKFCKKGFKMYKILEDKIYKKNEKIVFLRKKKDVEEISEVLGFKFFTI